MSDGLDGLDWIGSQTICTARAPLSGANNINRHIIVSLLALTVLKDSHNQHRLIIPHNRALENLNIHYNTAPLIMLQLLTQTWVKTAVQELRFLYA